MSGSTSTATKSVVSMLLRRRTKERSGETSSWWLSQGLDHNISEGDLRPSCSSEEVLSETDVVQDAKVWSGDGFHSRSSGRSLGWDSLDESLDRCAGRENHDEFNDSHTTSR